VKDAFLLGGFCFVSKTFYLVVAARNMGLLFPFHAFFALDKAASLSAACFANLSCLSFLLSAF
jgi:hypothetical protein